MFDTIGTAQAAQPLTEKLHDDSEVLLMSSGTSDPGTRAWLDAYRTSP